jgi:Rad3-related DNA helicase
MSIFDFIPKGIKLRDVQIKGLKEVEENWAEYDVFVLDEYAPASGKSIMAMIISNWRNSLKESAAILTPKAILQDQYQRDFPNVPSLKGKSKYPCQNKLAKTCEEYYEAVGNYCCGGCNYKEAVTEASESPNAIFNFHSHLFGGMVHDTYKDVLIIDEAHNLISMLSDVYTLQIWKHKEKYPEAHTKDDIIMWLSDEINQLDKDVKQARAIYRDTKNMPSTVRKAVTKKVRKLSRYKMIKNGLQVPQELFNIAKVEKIYGRGRKLKECIEVKPRSLKTVPHHMWPDGEVKKLVLMSATIYDKDMERLGIKRKRVKHIKGWSPIPPENRPIVVDPIAPMSFKHAKESSMRISNTIKKLAEQHTGKGVVHLTYGLVNHFKKYLKDDRYMWHTEKDKDEIYKQFLEAKDGKILMACGMAECIDLVGNDYEWQVLAKTIFPSLADPLYQYFLQKDPLVYNLETVRATVQQAGRICRTPTDYGITYILDASFASFYRRNYKLFPDYFVEAIQWRKTT